MILSISAQLTEMEKIIKLSRNEVQCNIRVWICLLQRFSRGVKHLQNFIKKWKIYIGKMGSIWLWKVSSLLALRFFASLNKRHLKKEREEIHCWTTDEPNNVLSQTMNVKEILAKVQSLFSFDLFSSRTYYCCVLFFLSSLDIHLYLDIHLSVDTRKPPISL